jgi:hypothetical protein
LPFKGRQTKGEGKWRLEEGEKETLAELASRGSVTVRLSSAAVGLPHSSRLHEVHPVMVAAWTAVIRAKESIINQSIAFQLRVNSPQSPKSRNVIVLPNFLGASRC